MRILLDECVNSKLAFPRDDVKTVAEMDWQSFKNGRLLTESATLFDVFVTLDRALQHQNAVGKYNVGVVVLVTSFNDLATYRHHFAAIRDAVRQTKPGQTRVVEI